MPPFHPSVGAVQGIVPHPSNADVIYLAAVNGGIWRTTNATSPNYQWAPLTDTQATLSIGAMAIDLTDAAAKTLVVASGRRSSFGQGGALIGVLRTTDGGNTWATLGAATLANQNLDSVVARGSLIMVGADSGTPGLFRSVNTGTTFSLISGAGGTGLPAGAVTHIVADAANANRFYTHVPGVGVYRSTDSGATWALVNNGATALTAGNVALAVYGAGGTSVVYAATIPGRGVASQVFRSTNSGTNWTAMDNVTANAAGNHHALIADPSNPNLVYLSGEYTRAGYPFSGVVMRGDASKAASTQWTQLTDQDGFGGSPGNAPHTDSRALAIDAAGNLLEGNDGGIYRMVSASTSTNGIAPGGGMAWTSLNNTLQITEMHHVAYDRVADVLFGGTQDNGSMSQQRPGQPIWSKDANGDASAVGVEFASTPGFSVRYYSSQNLAGFTRETRNSNNVIISSTQPARTPIGGAPTMSGQFVTPFAINAVDPLRLVIGAANGLYESTNQANTIARPGTSVANSLARMAYGGRIGTVTNADVLYVGVGSTVLVRTNGMGAPAASPVAFPGGTVQGVVMDPADWRIAYVIGPSRIYVTTSAGNNWTEVTGNFSGAGVGTFNSIEYLSLTSGNAIAVGTDLGVYLMRTASPGAWLALGDNLPNAPVFDMQFDGPDNLLAISTVGRGAWTYVFGTPTYIVRSLADAGPETLREGIERANQLLCPNIISFAVSGVITLQSQLPYVLASTAILGPGTNNLTISGNHAVDILAFAGGTTNRVSGVRFADAFSANHGAAIRNNGRTVLENCALSNNVTIQSFGGAVCNFPGGSLFVSNCVFVANIVRGGDGENRGPGSNGGPGGGGAGMGGAIFQDGDTLVLSSCAFSRNSALGGNGGNGDGNSFNNDAGGSGGFPNRGAGGAPGNPGGAGGFGGGGGGGAGSLGTGFAGGAGGFGGGGGGGGARGTGGSGGAGGAAGNYGGAGGGAFSSHSGGGGGGAGLGGAIFANSGAVTMVNCSFTANLATNGIGGAGSFGGGNGTSGQGVGGALFNINAKMIGQNVTYSGNLASTSQPDVEASTLVTNLADSGPGSLRQAICNAGVRPGPDEVTFAPGLSGGAIHLTSDSLIITNQNGPLTITATNLPGGLGLSGENAHNVFVVMPQQSLTLDSLTISNGAAVTRFGISPLGGGLWNFAGTATVRRCTFANNQSTFGGGLMSYQGVLTAEQCTFSGNRATSNGGAIETGAGTPIVVLRQCTIVSNTAAAPGGGVRFNSGTITLTHCLIAGNSAPGSLDVTNVSATYTSASYNLLGNGAGSKLTDGVNGNILTNPLAVLLGPLRNNGGLTPTHVPLGGNPAIDGGDPLYNGFHLTDQRGYPRVSNGRVDIGAVEGCVRTFYPFDNFTVFDAAGSSTPVFQGDGPAFWNTDHRGQANSAIALNDFVANTPFGTNNYYLLSTASGTNSNRELGMKGDFTVSAWIFPRLVGGDKMVLGNAVANDPGTLHLGLRDSNIYFGFWNNDLAGARTITAGQYYHVAWVYNSHGGQMAIYVNGQLDASAVGRFNTTKDANLYLGFCPAIAGSYFQGFIDEFAIFCEALSPSQIAALAAPAGPLPNTVLPEPVFSPGLALANCGWSVREIYAHTNDPAQFPYDLPTADYIASSPLSGKVTNYTSTVINRYDPDTNPSNNGFIGGGTPFAANNLTPQGLINGDDNYFVLAAQTTIHIAVEDDYTFGFSSDDGAQLRIKGAVFSSSTRLDANNPANPAHRGDTLSYPGNTGDSQTLGVSHLLPGTYDVEFLSWEVGGGSFAEVIAARGAKTGVDSTFRLLSPGVFLPTPSLAIARPSASQLVLSWSNGAIGCLQSAPTLLGPWTTIPAATNGMSLTPAGAARFFRLAE